MQPVRQLSMTVVGLSLSAVFVATYLVCVLGHLIFPGLSGFQTMLGLFLGFGWTFGGFLIGLIAALLYAWWAALIFVPVYNYLQRSSVAQPTRSRPPLPA